MSYVAIALPYLVQLLCIIHVLKNGRDRYWIFIVLFLPYIGGVAYLIIEILPSLGRRGNIGGIVDIVSRKLNPSYKIQEYASAAELTPTFQNKKILADEYLESGYFEKADSIYSSILSGVYKNDTSALLQRAKALYGMGKYEEGNEIIKALDAEGYEYKNESEAMIRLKIKENVEDARCVYGLYEAAKNKFNSFEIRYYFIEYLIRNDSANQALSEIDDVTRIKRQLDKNRMVYEKKWARMIENRKKSIIAGKSP